MEPISTAMCSLPDRSESDSESSFDENHLDSEEAVGWNARTGIDSYIKRQEVARKLVQKANRLVPLSSVIFRYNINWIRSDNESGWTHKALCPFHSDSTPSFGFNTKQERFNCFGCGKNGNAVQFIAFMEHKPLPEVARDLLCKVQSPDELLEEIEDDVNTKCDAILRSFSKDVRSFLYENSDNAKALPYVESVVWSLNVYLEKHSLNGTIRFEPLLARLEKLREQFALFGK